MLENNFQLKPSKTYLIALITILITTFAVILFLAIALWIKLFLFLSVAFYGGFILCKDGLLKGQNVLIRIQQQNKNQWILHTQKEIYSGEICGQSTVTHCILILRFRIPKHFFAKTCVIFPDSLKRDQFRELLMRLM